MIAVVTVLMAFPLGYGLRSHLAANVGYAIAYLWAFTYQTLYLTLDSIGGDESAFSTGKDSFPLSYGLVAAGIFAAGFGLVALGHRVAAGRRARVAA